MSYTLDILSQVVGWIYFSAWSVSFYGQCYVNYKAKSVEGFSLKFEVLNITGFLFYSIYNSMGYFAKSEGSGSVDVSDLAFGYHAFAMVLVQGVQCLIYKSNAINPPSRASAVAFFGYGKVLVTFIKYVPQVYWNWKRKSTVGWSIFNVLLDFTGGAFSFAQIVIDDLNGHGVADVFCNGLNIAKFVLSIVSIVFDIIFMIQHYLLYNPKRSKSNTDLDNSLFQAKLIQQEETP